MAPEDKITEADLDRHCKMQHEPIKQDFIDVKGWLEKLDNRIWMVLFAIIAAAAVNIWVTVSTRPLTAEPAPRRSKSKPVQAYYSADYDSLELVR